MSNRSYKNYMLGMLMVIMAFNYVDRLALGLLLQDIKVDLSLSDTQLGLLTGIAFALFYSVMGVPIARWADRGNRVTIITITTALWSLAVSLCGLAGNFLHLLLIRAGIAVGEAGCVPPAHSLIADYFDRAERPKAVAIYKLGIPLSAMIGYFVAGWLNELYGWRTTFVLLGMPGLVLALVAGLTLREPRKAGAASGFIGSAEDRRARATSRSIAQPSMKEVCVTLWSSTAFRHLLLGYSVAVFFNSGIGQWTPTFFKRSFGMQTGELGTWFAVISGIGGLFGTYVGGMLATRYAANNEKLQLSCIAMVYCACTAIAPAMYLSSGAHMALGLMAVVVICGSMIAGPLFATIQTLVPERMRAMSIALLFLFANLIGMGLGPLAAGMVSDWFRSWAGDESLRYALLTLCPGYLWAAWHLLRASKTVTHDLDAAEQTRSNQVARENHLITGRFRPAVIKPAGLK